MIQTGRVVSVKNGIAEISVVRETSCGESCASCSSKCSLKDVSVRADSPDGINPGDIVIFEMAASKVLFAAFLAYITPLIAMILSYTVTALAGIGEGLSFVISLVVMGIWFVVMHFVDKRIKHMYRHTILGKAEGDI